MSKKDVVTYTAMAAAVFAVGLFLFAQDMRTVGVPAEHVFLADIATCLLAVVALFAGVPAIAMRFARD